MRTGVEPGHAAAHDLDIELLQLQVAAVHVGDFQFAARRGLEIARDVADLRIVEIQAGDGIARLRLLGLFLDADGTAFGVEGDDAVALRIGDGIGKHRSASVDFRGLLQLTGQFVAIEDVVAQYQRGRVVADEIATDDEGLRQTVGGGLHGVLDVQSPAGTVAEQLFKAWRVLRRRDEQDVADARQHQRGERVVDHRLVVDRQQLLGYGERGRVQPGAGAAGEDDAFAGGECAHCRGL